MIGSLAARFGSSGQGHVTLANGPTLGAREPVVRKFQPNEPGRITGCWLLLCVVAAPAAAELGYRVPPKEIVAIVDAKPTPDVIVSPTREAILFVDYESAPPIDFLARDFLRIGGLRIDSRMGARQRTRRRTGITVQSVDGLRRIRVILPPSARIGQPLWSPDGRRFAFTRDLDDGVELWVAEATTGKAGRIGQVRVNDVLSPGRDPAVDRGRGSESPPFAWMRDNRRLLVRLVPASRGAPPPPHRVPVGPMIEETAGKISQVPTFEDLLKDAHDEDLFDYFGNAQLALVDCVSGAATPIGATGLFTSAVLAPDEQHLLLTRLRRPFSYRVPYHSFTRSVEVVDLHGKRLATIADLPVSDDVPRQGVHTGPRGVEWQPLQEATLVWVEALDGGNPLKDVPHRDRIMTLGPPFSEAPREILRLKHRFAGLHWTASKGEALLEERNRQRRWTTTYLVDLSAPTTMRTMFDRSINDAYGDPGQPVMQAGTAAERVLLQDGEAIYLHGNGASQAGDRPFLDKLDLRTLRKERLFQSEEKSLDRFVSFVGGTRSQIVVRHESNTDPPNWFAVDLGSGKRTRLSDLPDPVPQFTGVRKELIRYARKDGVALSGTLFLPPNYVAGTRLPLLIWAYPLEYSDADTAGQVRVSPNSFSRPMGASPLLLVTQGYAVLDNATIPIVGDPETMNNTYVEQISAGAEAAIAKLDTMGIVDPKRVAVGGHSYGAFMTANLLAHTNLFAAGIARSGAYNRSLTPFGFQTERRSYWEATDLYTRVSPFTYADRIKQPILLIHGEADDNTGTFPIQSERLFQAIRGNGGVSRLVLLPYEAHAYRARESILHTLAEMLDWMNRYVRDRSTAQGSPKDPPPSHKSEAR